MSETCHRQTFHLSDQFRPVRIIRGDCIGVFIRIIIDLRAIVQNEAQKGFMNFYFAVVTRACLQLRDVFTRTDQNQTRNTVLFCSAAGTLGIPKSVVE